uniref:hypothetical protein n=1 Tax=Clostridium sp. NkU-1 TaxID=1095009 RepID=UPI000A60A4BB
MKIIGANDLSEYEINNELRNGGKLVIYQFCISILVMTFKRGSDIYLIRAGESAFVKGLGYTLLSLILMVGTPMGANIYHWFNNN